MRVTLEFSGGLDTLFGGRKRVEVDIPAAADGGTGLSVADAIAWARENLLEERPDLFVKGDSVRPGILVLVNDEDWELSGGLASTVGEGDRITFISTLHGG